MRGAKRVNSMAGFLQGYPRAPTLGARAMGVIPAGRIQRAIGVRFLQRAFDSQWNRQETKPPSAATRKRGLCEQ